MSQDLCYKLLKEKQTKLSIKEIANELKLSRCVVAENLRRLSMLGMIKRELIQTGKKYSGGQFLFSIK